MKNPLRILCLIVFALSSCQQENQDLMPESDRFDINELDFDYGEIETAFNKEIEVFDITGNYSITLLIGSDFENVVEAYLQQVNLRLGMMFSEENSEIHTNDFMNKIEGKILDEIEIHYHVIKLNLKSDAIGFYLEIENSELETANSRLMGYSVTTNYNSPNTWMNWGRVDYLHTNNQNPDFNVSWYYRSCRLCSMKFDYSVLLSQNMPQTIYHRVGERRLRAKVRHNWFNHKVYFKKRQNDNWIPRN